MKSLMPILRATLLTSTVVLSACSDESAVETTVQVDQAPKKINEIVDVVAVDEAVSNIKDSVVGEELDVVNVEAKIEELSDSSTSIQAIENEPVTQVLAAAAAPVQAIEESVQKKVEAPAQKVIEKIVEEPKQIIQEVQEVEVIEPALVEAEPVVVPVAATFETRTGLWTKKSQKIKGQWRIEMRSGDAYLVLGDDFKTRKAPDLKFVLSKQSVNDVSNRNALDDALFISNLTSPSGSQEYKLPENFTDYTTLLLHCEKYTKLWGAADIR